MPRTRTALLTTIAMFAFAGNSLLCRLALKGTAIDPSTFTLVRIVSAALVLWLIRRTRGVGGGLGGNWASALALFVYAAGFSLAYVRLAAGTGALLLFGAVQATMIGYGVVHGERMRVRQWMGLLIALAGLVWLVLPRAVSALSTPVGASMLMLGAGAAWGVYSLRGRSAVDPVATTAGNFLRAVPFAVALSVATIGSVSLDGAGLAYAIVSGAVTSGAGYIVWYAALKQLKASSAASVQLSVPVITAAGGIVLLGEPLTVRLLVGSAAILGGVALVIAGRKAH
ncbi:DMT family transporter [Caballeronia humi]|uniref:Membrane protein n=1 Tax=Caballeronia humi TaxID=326474 RepID=A0A158FU83_9BURK|nr:DMT family transporter [Caballeronia humi]SAL22909.1 membrane protein [Caballeronia humi]